MKVMKRIEQTDFADISHEYREFCDKFKPKHTTDDCFTPENIYAVVLDWVRGRYGIGEDTPIVRPFYPGGDYQREEYPDGCVVVDNPPFSILSQIVRWYNRAGVRYFLFGPALTIFSSRDESNYIIAAANIVFANGADINCSFVTNMGENLVETAPDLRDALKAADDENRKEVAKQQPKNAYPDAVISAAAMNYLTVHHTPFAVRREDAVFIRRLDEQAGMDKAIFGGGFLLSERAAAERAAAERAAAERAAAERAAAERAAAERAAAHQWHLTDREREIQRMMAKGGAR